MKFGNLNSDLLMGRLLNRGLLNRGLTVMQTKARQCKLMLRLRWRLIYCCMEVHESQIKIICWVMVQQIILEPFTALKFVDLDAYHDSSAAGFVRLACFSAQGLPMCSPPEEWTKQLACIAIVSVVLGSKERQRNGTGTVFCPHEVGARAKIRKRGWGRGGKETLADKPLDLENLRSPANGARDWLEQSNIIDTFWP